MPISRPFADSWKEGAGQGSMGSTGLKRLRRKGAGSQRATPLDSQTGELKPRDAETFPGAKRLGSGSKSQASTSPPRLQSPLHQPGSRRESREFAFGRNLVFLTVVLGFSFPYRKHLPLL